MKKSLVSYRQHPFWKTSDKESGDCPDWKIFEYLNKKCPNVELFRCCIFWYIFYLTMIRHIVVYALRDPERAFYLPPKFDKILSSRIKIFLINWPLGILLFEITIWKWPFWFQNPFFANKLWRWHFKIPIFAWLYIFLWNWPFFAKEIDFEFAVSVCWKKFGLVCGN